MSQPSRYVWTGTSVNDPTDAGGPKVYVLDFNYGFLPPTLDFTPGNNAGTSAMKAAMRCVR
jgi:hypothetical protein